MKSSSYWVSGTAVSFDTQQPLDVDADGWVRSLLPGQVARTVLSNNAGRYPAGQYVVRFKGTGAMKIDGGTVVSSRAGEIVLQVTPSSNNNFMVEISATNPADYLREITFTMPGGICEGDPFTTVASAQVCGTRRFLSFADNSGTVIFNPVFLSKLRNYSVLRFMDWGATNNSEAKTWTPRNLVSNRQWWNPPIEVMIELCNRLGAHPWFTIPHQTDDAYSQNFAQLVKAKLNPNLRVYVEYSNEVWNWYFQQTSYANAQGKLQNPPINHLQYYALRSRAVGAIFKDVLGSSRVVAVIGAQSGSQAVGVMEMDYLKARFGTATGIDAIAIAPYLAVAATTTTINTYEGMTLDALFAEVRTQVLQSINTQMKNYRILADSYSLSLIAYEGGQHLVSVGDAQNNDRVNALFFAFNRDPRIKQLYLDYLALWKAAGGQLFVHYNDVGEFSKFGSWGSLERVDQLRSAAPKFDALQTFIEQNPVWWSQ